MGEKEPTSEVSRSKNITQGVSARTRAALWAKAAGRCQYTGCNKPLLYDHISCAEDRNFGFVAHIVAATPTGPRGDPVRSPLLVDDVSNLMLLCHVHHKLIDVDEPRQHPEDRLIDMKRRHEHRIETLTAISEDQASHVLRYAANIGGHVSPIAYEQVRMAMLPDRYPATGRNTIDLEVRGSALYDHEPEFWAFERSNLKRQFEMKVRERIEMREIRHLSVFALAPQPLLIELGRLLCDIVPADVYQLHREPKGWAWPEDGAATKYRVRKPSRADGRVALVFALSATVVDERITAVLGPSTSIWAVTAEHPHNDHLKRPADLAEFRRVVRSVLNQIKAQHGEQAVINVFPVMPVSAAVEVGRVWMPKADLPLVIHDQNRSSNGFVKALTLGLTELDRVAA